MADRLDTLQKTLDDYIKMAADRFSTMEERQRRMEETLSHQGASGSGENSTSKNRDRGSGGYNTNNNSATKITKLEFPKYSGQEDPTTWICRVEQYFVFKQIEERERLPLATYHLEGES